MTSIFGLNLCIVYLTRCAVARHVEPGVIYKKQKSGGKISCTFFTFIKLFRITLKGITYIRTFTESVA